MSITSALRKMREEVSSSLGYTVSFRLPWAMVIIVKDPVSSQAVVAHAFNPRTQEVEEGRSLSSRPAWSTE